MDMPGRHSPLSHTEFQEERFPSDFSESTSGLCLLPLMLAEAQSWKKSGLVAKKSDYDQRLFKDLGNTFLSIGLEFLQAWSLASA